MVNSDGHITRGGGEGGKSPQIEKRVISGFKQKQELNKLEVQWQENNCLRQQVNQPTQRLWADQSGRDLAQIVGLRFEIRLTSKWAESRPDNMLPVWRLYYILTPQIVLTFLTTWRLQFLIKLPTIFSTFLDGSDGNLVLSSPLLSTEARVASVRVVITNHCLVLWLDIWVTNSTLTNSHIKINTSTETPRDTQFISTKPKQHSQENTNGTEVPTRCNCRWFKLQTYDK